MLTFHCRDLGMDCVFQTSATTKEELMKKIAQHGASAHGIDVIPPDLAAKIDRVIRY